MMSEMDVNAIAGTLKLYFRELPEPLFTDEFYPNFAEGIGEHGRHLPLPSYLLCPLCRGLCFSPNSACAGGTQNQASPRRPLSVLQPPALLSLSSLRGYMPGGQVVEAADLLTGTPVLLP